MRGVCIAGSMEGCAHTNSRFRYHPHDIVSGDVLMKIVECAWEMGESHLCLIHDHGRFRGRSPGSVNPNTGYFGLEIRRALRHDPELRERILYTTLDCKQLGALPFG